MTVLRLIVRALVIVGALNWGLVGFFNYNPISDYLGMGWARAVYAIVGLAGLLAIVCLCRSCGSCGCSKSGCKCSK